MASERFNSVAQRCEYSLDGGCEKQGSQWACNAGAVREPAHRWCGLLLRVGGLNVRANGGARRSLVLSLGVGDRRIAVGIGFRSGVSRITRTRPDVLGPSAHPDLGVTVRTGLGGLFALAFSL